METQTNGKMIIMRRYIIYLLSIFVLISCSKEQDTIANKGVNYSPKFYAEIDNTPTRTYVTDSLKICWNENDKLSVFTSTANQLYQFDGNTGDLEGTFSAFEMNNSSIGTSLTVNANYAVYPYNEETTLLSDGTLTLTLPQTQVYAKNSFGANSNPMIAVTENKTDTYLSFKNICGYLRLYLYGDDITAKSIRLEGNTNERISGKINISISFGQEPIVSLAEDASYNIILDCQNGIKIGESASEATELWFVIPPVTFENGFTLIIEDINGNRYSKSTEKKIEIKRNTISNMVASKVEQLIEYEELTYEEDGIDAIVTNEGLFALLKQLPDSENYIFLCGDINDDKRSCMLIDKNGFLNTIDFGNGITNSIMYTSNSLLLLESSGSIQYEIPYTALFDDDQINAKGTRAADYTQSRIYNALDLYNNIESYIDGQKKYVAKYLIRSYLEGRHGRKGSIAADIIDIVSNPKDLLALDKLLNRIDEFLFFGNASVLALDAIMKNPVSFCLPCEVKGLNPNPDFTKAIDEGVYATKLLEHSYTLKMFAQCDEQTSSESYNKEEVIDDNGIVNFDFTFLELSALYSYEPRLTVNLKYEAWISEDVYYRIAGMVPNAPVWTPNSQIFQKSCTFYGIGNYLVTGSVSSSVENIENVKYTTADVICSFSDVPKGAECEVLINEEGTDMSLVYPGQPNSNNQKVSVTGLRPFTTYKVSSCIIYKGRPYNSKYSVRFTTTGPSGYIKSIKEYQNSADITCVFNNLESGVDCGIIVEGRDGFYQKLKASNTEKEQTITISGLSAAIWHLCKVYVSYSSYYSEGQVKEFRTLTADITGTWYTPDHTIILNADGTAESSSSKEPNSIYGEWRFDGHNVNIFVGDIYTEWPGGHEWGGREWNGTVNDRENPTKIVGYTGRWVGWGSMQNPVEVILTR